MAEGGKISQMDEERKIYCRKNERDGRERRRGREKPSRDSDDGGGSFREITGFTGTHLNGC